MVKQRSQYTSGMKRFSEPRPVTVANGSVVMAEGTGSVHLGNLTLTNVWFVPDLRVNLISVDALNLQDYDVNFKTGGEAWVIDNSGCTIATAQKKNSLRHLVVTNSPPA